MEHIYVITLITKKDLNDLNVLTFDDGTVFGRILNKSGTYGLFYYDVETNEDSVKRLNDGTGKLFNIEEYRISQCNTEYTIN